ncbi:hypothetical protein [Halarcobacter sp.]|uniref:hypothetical protein n=1 Tax=Halarcobacter sp. TaxID=2321133 RepID=UPI003A8E4ED7
MGIDNFIETAMKRVLKNPIVLVLRDISFSSILNRVILLNEILENSISCGGMTPKI